MSKESLFDAYRNAGPETRDVLGHLVPELDSDFRKSLPVIERVKTWDDVVRELGYDPVERLLDHTERGDGFQIEPDEIAYIKLKAIAKVLNEGWEPKFVKGEWRWFPWFYLYTQDEIDKMTPEKRSRVVLRSFSNANALGGVASALANYDSSSAYTLYGSRLAFKTEELAVYAGKQFTDIWADFVFRANTKSAGAEK
ncbi:MAG: hypothetical protein IKR72_02935 [Bacteroidales bacterium]|nr:hypothetical protein [Bacteroidales bacterium]